MYLAEAIHTMRYWKYNINSPNHLPCNSVHTAFCVPQKWFFIFDKYIFVVSKTIYRNKTWKFEAK